MGTKKTKKIKDYKIKVTDNQLYNSFDQKKKDWIDEFIDDIQYKVDTEKIVVSEMGFEIVPK